MKRWLGLILAAACSAAGATNYSFPSNKPAGCSNGGAGTYNCGSITLAYGDTIAISGARPATINISGDLSTNNAIINAAGNVSDLNVIVSGTLTLGYQASIKGNVTAGSVNDAGGGSVLIDGNLTATAGNISLAYQSSVTGNVSVAGAATLTTGQAASVGGNVSAGSGKVTVSESGTVAGSITSSGAVVLNQFAVVNGSVSAGTGSVQLDYLSKIKGNVTTGGAVTLAQAAQVNGSISGAAGNVSVGYGATVGGTLTTSTGTIDFAQTAAANACVRSTGGASITLGFQSVVNSVCCGVSCSNSCVVNNSTYAMPPLCTASTTLVADYRMDETAWNGTAAEVKDSGPNAYHGKAAAASGSSGLATTASGSPADGSASTGSCNYGLFNRSTSPSATHAYVQLPSGFPSMTSSFTVLAWIRSTAPTQSGQRIIVNDDNDNGWALSLGDVGSASLRLFNRNVSPAGSVTIGGSNGAGASNGNCGGSTLCLDSAPIFAANSWYYIAASVDTSVKQVQTQIYNTSGSLLASATSAYTGNWAAGSGGTALGGESASSPEGVSSSFHFNGNIDELQVYTGVLSSSQIAAQLSRSRSCPASTVGSFAIGGTGSASTCTPQTLTITARDASGNTLTNYTGTISLSTSSGRGDWSLGSGPAPSGTFSAGAANSGLASYTFAAADAGIVKLRLSHSLAQAVTVTVVDASVPASSTSSAAISYSNNAFVWTEDLNNKIAGSNIVVAGRNHDLQVALIKKDPSTGSCGVATDFNGARSLKLWRTDNGGPWAAPSASVGASTYAIPAARPTSNNLPLSFASGVASLNLATSDVGKYTLNLDDDSLSYASTTVSGSLGDLTVRPFTIAVSGLTLAGTANPGGSAATDAVFGKAGAAFSATVAAYRWSSSADSNDDGVPDAGATLAQVSAGGLAPSFNASVTLSPTAGSQTPAGGVLGTLANNVVSSFSGGTASPATLSYSEVGSFLLNTSAVTGNYLNTAGLALDATVFGASGAQNSRVGRFVPAGFALGSPSVTHRSALTCNPASGFTYVGENFQVGFTLTAQNAAGATTQNYAGSFAKLDLTAAANLNLAGIAGTTMFKPGGRLVPQASSGSWSAGAATTSLTAQVASAASPDGPFDTAQFGVAPQDSDGVTMLSLNLDTDSPANGADRALLGTIPLRQGRLRLQNGMSAPNRALRLPLAAQYWNGTAYITNTLDSCTRITAANLSFGNYRKTLATLPNNDAVLTPATVTVANGQGIISLAAPSGGRLGSMDIAIALDSATPPADQSCLSGWAPAKAATQGANLIGLRSPWCGGSKDPSARATWGLYRGSDGVIFQRENF